MKRGPDFVQRFFSEAEALLKAHAVGDPLFSRGTYQVEVQEKGKKREVPFLQLKEDGSVSDFFCSCRLSEEGNGCPHLAAAYLRIFSGHEEPLHVRFSRSFWSAICWMASRRHGYETSCLKKSKEGCYLCESKTKKRLFSIEAQTPAAKKQLLSLIEKRAVETEETSIKFSNLPAEEIAQFRKGEASPSLRYELSFWSDLAKWLTFLAESGASYEIQFKGSPLPHELHLKLPPLQLWFYISEVSWPALIPSLATVQSNLQLFDREEERIESVTFDEASCSLHIQCKEGEGSKPTEGEGYPVGDFLYVEGKGFYRRSSDLLFRSQVIPKESIGEVLQKRNKELRHFLKVDLEPRKSQYRLFFDEQANLHIEMYVLESGDLASPRASLFLPWAYLPGRGFFLLEDSLFEEKEKIVPKKEVADFINHHRLWLHNFPGFHTHLGSLESHLTYRLKRPEKELLFDAELNFPQEYEEVLNFDEWVYIKGEGFYMKKESRGRLPLHPGLRIPKEEISSFIMAHRDDLEQVQNFFNPEPILQRAGLKVFLNEQKRIEIVPQMEYVAGVDPSQVELFGNVLYVEGRGFTEIPLVSRLPERYRTSTVIAPTQEAAFLAYELEPLRPYILDMDARLKEPTHLTLHIRRIVREKRRRKREWLLSLNYESELGTVDIFSLWDAFQERVHHLFSPAGLLFLKEPRFNWIRQLHKKRLDRARGVIRLNTLEWIRLSVFEEAQAPRGESPEAVETRNLLEELNRFEAHRLLDVSLLQAVLRPYQEEGLRWLWFLYCHGLSGLLCDDMGLGKTHQAMALLAAIAHEDPERKNRYLVVCPTSVIYHWQEQLKRFLPHLRVCTYYGLARSLEDFDAHYDLLLTSYGILRTGRENLRGIRFELAIYDEIQIAKNYASQTNRFLRAINAQMRLGLTGTPIENRLRELKSLIDLTLPNYLPHDALFRDLFINPIEKGHDEEKKRLLSRLVKPFLLRRKKSEVLRDLPEKIEEIAYCDLSDEQKQLYREITDRLRGTIYQDLKDENRPVSYVHVFSALSTLKQICDHPALLQGTPKEYAAHASGKWDLFVELLYEARDSGQKVVVFSQYLDMLAIIEAYLKKKGIGFATIKGSTRNRSEQLQRFREDPACEVFVASLLAAGVGIDLTVASIVIHYDRWWNPAKENQATDRVHRIGQNRGVQVFKLVTKNTIEEHIHEMIERKKGLLEEIIGMEDQIQYLSRDELLHVFDLMFQEQ